MEFGRELALEVIQDAPSRIASMSSVANEGLGFSSICLTGGHSLEEWTAERFFLITNSVRIRQPSIIVLDTAMIVEYDNNP